MLEVQGGGLSRCGFLWSLSPWLAKGGLLAMSSLSHPSLGVVCVLISFSYKNASDRGLRPHTHTYDIIFLTSLKVLSPSSTVTVGGTGPT